MVILILSKVDRKTQSSLELVLFVPFWSHSKSHTKAQLEWPKRLVQLDNQLYVYVLERMNECLTFTYIPNHIHCCYKILYVSLLITDYLIRLAFWPFPIGF